MTTEIVEEGGAGKIVVEEIIVGITVRIEIIATAEEAMATGEEEEEEEAAATLREVATVVAGAGLLQIGITVATTGTLDLSATTEAAVDTEEGATEALRGKDATETEDTGGEKSLRAE